MDGAVNGMVSRLLRVAFSPDEAFCLAQAAYIKEQRRAQGLPIPVLERQQVTWEINQALKLLGDFPLGPETHRQRIILWEKIFGRGSWHEPIDPEWIYGTSVSENPETNPSDDERSSALIEGALRYFGKADMHFLGDRLMTPATLFRGEADDQKHWNGFLMVKDGTIGFFEESDCFVENTSDGDPLIFQLTDLRAATAQMPHGVSPLNNLTHIRFRKPSNNFVAHLAYGDGPNLMQFAIHYEDIPEDSSRENFKLEALESGMMLLTILEKALDLNDSGSSSGSESNHSVHAFDPKPEVRIPEGDELFGLPAFDAAQDAMMIRFVDNGTDPRMLWPLMDQYLQPLVFRYPLRAYMTDEAVSGELLVQQYINYVGQSMTLVEISDISLANDQLGVAENEALKEFVYKSVGDLYALIMCAIERADRERLLLPDGSLCHLGGADFLRYSVMLDEIVSAQDTNDPVRLMQQFLEGQQDA